MPRLTPETVKVLARQLYDYELSDDAAISVAHIVGAMTAYGRRLESLTRGGLQPAFDYPATLAEARRIHRGRANE
jgi:hypothetical protein